MYKINLILNSDAVHKFTRPHLLYDRKKNIQILLFITIISKPEKPPRVSKRRKTQQCLLRYVTPCNGATCAQIRGQQIQNCFLDNTWLLSWPPSIMVKGGPHPWIWSPSLIKELGTRSYAIIMAHFINPRGKQGEHDNIGYTLPWANKDKTSFL